MTFHRHAANTRLNFCAKETDEKPEIEIERSAELKLPEANSTTRTRLNFCAKENMEGDRAERRKGGVANGATKPGTLMSPRRSPQPLQQLPER